ncbi:MAG: pyrimidine 5'-nucleotidase [Rhodovibrionaceae bacterium]|nr:pyrimidine 5'-nucleotidase [Rhodovibrionaceae bacterium]
MTDLSEAIATRRTPPQEVEVWLFDLDNTLYPASCRLFDQVERRMAEFICGFLSITEEEAHALRRQYWQEHGTTLSGLMLNHGLDPEDFLAYVHEIDLSAMRPDARLNRALERLPGRKLVFTNGSMRHAARILERLELTHHFEAVFDIAAADYVPKPESGAYDALVRRHDVRPDRALFVEDTAKNLPPAARMGMTTLWLHHEHSRPPEAEAEAHIHHRTDDLAGWIEGLLEDRARR